MIISHINCIIDQVSLCFLRITEFITLKNININIIIIIYYCEHKIDHVVCL